jgi:23S rRNA (cytosine1962-C5)-methyltransferase
MYKVILKPGREKSIIRRHPWIFSGAIAEVIENPDSGDTVNICDSRDNFLAYGAYSPESQIRTRIWTWDRNEKIDREFFRARLQKAVTLRESIPGIINLDFIPTEKIGEYNESQVSAFRLVHAESDGLPGLIVDQYGEVLVMQVLSAGMEKWRDVIAELLLELTKARHIFERSDAEVRKLENLVQRIGPVKGDPPETIVIKENGLLFKVSLISGQKTGFYLDQRINRKYIQSYAAERNVLDCFSYTGGFSLNALRGGAKSVTAIDVSIDALNIARENLELNHLPTEKIQWLEKDVFQQLRKFRDQGVQFDLVILDPPKFAPTSSQVHKASRGYKDINLLAFKLIRSGGMLATFSCSGGVSPQLFQKIVADAALDAGVEAKIIQQLSQSPDHPIALNFPEGAYLKGMLIKVEK